MIIIITNEMVLLVFCIAYVLASDLFLVHEVLVFSLNLCNRDCIDLSYVLLSHL